MTMKTKTFLFISILLVGVAIQAAAQVPTAKEMWQRYDAALQADIKAYQQAVAQAEEARKQAEIHAALDSIRACMRKPYSANLCSQALDSVQTFAANPYLKAAERKTLEEVKRLIENYPSEAKRFIDVFAGEITDNKFVSLTQMQVENLIPSQVRDILEFLIARYDQNGLASLTFDAGYEYLNQKLSEMRESITNLLQKDDDARGMYEQLTEILKIECELSEEHLTYRQLK